MNETKLALLYLLSQAANSQKAVKEQIENIDIDALYNLCKEHLVAALVSSVLAEHLKDKPEQYAKWQQEQFSALYRDMNFADERAKIISFLEQKGIWYMPLKGVVLKQYYPKPELREFADNDILFDPDFEAEVEEFMLSRGFIRKQTDSGHVMEYEKKPCLNFEMHRALYHTNNPVFYEYYKDVKSRLIKDEDNDFGYHFSDEDFYIFMVSHMYRHFRDNGTGIRSLLDIYVYNKAKGDTLDFNYIEKELEKIEALEYEKQVRALSDKLFSGETLNLSEEEERLTEYYFASGVYGTKEISTVNAMKKMTGDTDFSKKGRRKYWIKRLFNMEYYKQNYPRAYKTGIAIPFLIVFRFFRGLTKTDKIKAENEKLKRIEDNKK